MGINFTDISLNTKENYRVDRPGRHIFFMFNRSGNIKIDIKCEGAEVYIYGLYVGRDTQIFQVNTTQHHAVGNSISDLLIKGVFYDESKFLYEGLIRIDKKAQKSNAYQKNQNLVMSSGVFVDSRPYLEILANDVRCTHGSTTGRLNNDQIYYCQARGISMKQAKDLLIKGFVNDIFSKIDSLGSSKEIDRYRQSLSFST